MKVKCINIYNEHTKEFQEISPWITIGKEYIVLAIEGYKNRIAYLLVGDNENMSPGLHNASQFQIISGKIPRNWEVSQGDIELFTIGPKAWREIGFWEDCYDGDLKALEIYKLEARIIYEEEGAL